ncbi:response regulator [Mucilaginibacter kameinonensis]|uniref:response regulator n=1 Tax=Mucilaginibacter kameinonensis TaxID=452286 RepID=UPI000EF84121|nr:response regulator [Mucilaginibacter kameinonensis]
MGKRILIFDDDAAILDLLQVLLDYEGFETSIAGRTDDLFYLIRLCRPELILIDFSLYGINGGEWCAKLKSSLEFSVIPVIISTAYTNKELKSLNNTAPNEDYLC